MRQIVTFIIFFLTSQILPAQTTSINGEIIGIDSAEIQITILPWRQGEDIVFDKIICQNSQFEYSVKLNSDIWYLVNLNSDKFNSVFGIGKNCSKELKNREISFLIMSGDKINISARVDEFGINYQVYGNTINLNRNEYEKQIFPLSEEYNRLVLSLETLKSDSLNPKFKDLEIKLNHNIKKTSESELRIISGHPKWIYSAYMLTIFPYDTINKYFKNLDQNVKDTFWGQRISEMLYRATINSQSPEFTLLNEKGNEISLSNYIGKYVVLDFWRTWCGGCIREMPNLKTHYLKYKDNIEFISICCKDQKSSWLKAIDKYQMNWTNLFSPDDEVVNKYGIESFPTKLFIDRTGKIISKSMGVEREFYEKIDDIMNNYR